MKEQLDSIMSLMSELYQSWGCCRVLEMGVSNLGRCDSRGWSYQLYSPGLGDWVEVGGGARKFGGWKERGLKGNW